MTRWMCLMLVVTVIFCVAFPVLGLACDKRVADRIYFVLDGRAERIIVPNHLVAENGEVKVTFAGYTFLIQEDNSRVSLFNSKGEKIREGRYYTIFRCIDSPRRVEWANQSTQDKKEDYTKIYNKSHADYEEFRRRP